MSLEVGSDLALKLLQEKLDNLQKQIVASDRKANELESVKKSLSEEIEKYQKKLGETIEKISKGEKRIAEVQKEFDAVYGKLKEQFAAQEKQAEKVITLADEKSRKAEAAEASLKKTEVAVNLRISEAVRILRNVSEPLEKSIAPAVKELELLVPKK